MHPASAPTSARSRLPTVFLRGAVIDFLEEIKILPNHRVVRVELESLLVSRAGLVQLSFVLVGDSQVVEGGGVGRIDLGGAFPAIDRLPPQSPLRDLDAELDLFLGIAPLIGSGRASGTGQNKQRSSE